MKIIIVTAFMIFSLNSMAAKVGVPDEEKASSFFKRTFEEQNAVINAFQEENADQNSRNITLEGEFGILNTTGNTDTSLNKFVIDAEHDLPRWFNQYSIQALRQVTEVDDEKLETSRLQLLLEFDYKLSNIKNRMFVLTEYDDNQFLALRDQITAVAGWRHLWLQSDTITFMYSIGPGYAHSRQQDTGDSFEGGLLRSSADFTYTFENEAKIRQAIIAEVNESATTVNSITSATAKIFDDLALKFSFEITKDENVASDIDDVSTQTSVSLVYQFF